MNLIISSTTLTLLPLTFVINCVKSQFNVYGINLKLIKMRLDSGHYLQQYELQVDYTNSNKTFDYGTVTVLGVQDQTDYIFIEAMNQNPFHVSKVEIQGDVCFRLLVQNSEVLFAECSKIRDLYSGNAYYSSKYVTRTKRDGSVLMYQIVQYMVENRDRTRTLLEKSFIEAQLNKLPTACPCTIPVVLASFQGALLLLLGFIFGYWKFWKHKLAKKSSLHSNNNSSLNGDLRPDNQTIYAENAISTCSIACYAPPQLKHVNANPIAKSQTTSKSISPYHVTSKIALLPLPSETESMNNLNGPVNTTSTSNNNSLCPTLMEKQDDRWIDSGHNAKQDDTEKRANDVKRLSKSIIEQVLNKKFAKAPADPCQTSNKQNLDKKSTKKLSLVNAKKAPPSPPPPDYKNYGFSESEDEQEESEKNTGCFDEGRIYDRLESPKY